MLMKWDPFSEMNRLHDSLFRSSESGLRAFSPAVDIQENDKEFKVIAEVPGMNADDIKVDVNKNILTISGERKFEEQEENETYRRVERGYGSFTRSFSLPETVNADEIDADLENGILTLMLPKREAPKGKRISIKTKN